VERCECFHDCHDKGACTQEATHECSGCGLMVCDDCDAIASDFDETHPLAEVGP
jgi:hypothetical protein